MNTARNIFLPGAALLCVAVSLVLRHNLAEPWVWVCTFPAWAAAFGLLAIWLRRAVARYACLLLMSLFLALFGAETMFALEWSPSLLHRGDIGAIRQDRNEPGLVGYGGNRNRKDPILGYAPRPKRERVGSRLLYNGQVMYDVVYSSLDSGWRVTPQHPDADTAVVFFGCSFTYGEGLEDAESYPYRVGEILGERYQTFNFGFHGYGSHQMLAQVENGFLDDIAKRYSNIIVYYMTLDMHELRSAGVSLWDSNGPWYVLENGEPVYKGGFKKNTELTPTVLGKFFRKSLVFQKIFGTKITEIGPMRELHTAIIAKSGALVKERYGAEFYTLLWPGAAYRPFLEEKGVHCVELASVFPDWDSARAKYVIPNDGHPNAMAAGMAAKAIAAHAASFAAKGKSPAAAFSSRP